MSNNYFTIERESQQSNFQQFKGYKRKMKMLISAVVGANSTKAVAIEIITKSNVKGETGKAFIILDTHLEIQSMIDALQARLNGQVSATVDKRLPSVINGKLEGLKTY